MASTECEEFPMTMTSAERATIATRFDPRSNSLNALRLTMATLVIVSHSWVLSGQSDAPPGWGNQFIGDIAVDGFFAISGFLILASRLSCRSLGDFLWRRFLRIWPAFAVVLVVVAFVIAPLTAFVVGNGSYDPLSALTYVGKNIALWIFQPGIEATPVGIPEAGNWNAPLWTLAYEFACYIAIGLIVAVFPRRAIGPVLWIALAGAIGITILATWTTAPIPDPLVVLARLAGFFVSGSLLFHYRERMPSTWPVGMIAAIVCILLVVGQVFDVFGGPAFAVLLLWLGITLPLRKVGAVNDISYGMYIYAYPLQLVLAVLVGSALNEWLFAAISIAVTIPFAAASWFLVERPAMRLKRLTSGGRSSRDGAADAPAI
jgi:peptidoglycan/LPS O-acetylase OafA/YrhL